MARDFEEWFQSEAAASCAQHPARAAEIACERCGVYQCESCVDEAERTLCSACAAIVMRARIPRVTQGIAWKLILAPAFALVSALLLAAKHVSPPPLLAIWFVPVACAVGVLLTRRAVFGWLGVVSSLSMLGYQAVTALGDGSFVMVSDVAMLAIAPVAATWGCLALGRESNRVAMLVAYSSSR